MASISFTCAAGIWGYTNKSPLSNEPRGASRNRLGRLLLGFALTVIIARYANLYWLEVLAVPIMVLVGLDLIWGLNE